MKKKKIDLVAAARPNFMKIAPLYHSLRTQEWCDVRVIHTGQHYDANMSKVFFDELGLPSPTANLEVGSGTHAEQTGHVMIAYERWAIEDRPDWTVVVGDVNSTIACTLAATKLGIPVAHLEAGLRSGDRSMPEEINRLATDALSDVLWTPSPDADENLAREGVLAHKIVRVGNIMIDSLELMRDRIRASMKRSELGLSGIAYGIATLHRPSNVDDPSQLSKLITVLREVALRTHIVFPLHPRTHKRILDLGLLDQLSDLPKLHLLSPLGYVDFMSLVEGASFVLTDSGGVQEETTYLGVPCITLRENTERPITITEGTNRLVHIESIVSSVDEAIAGQWPKGKVPALWDGRTADRVRASLKVLCGLSA